MPKLALIVVDMQVRFERMSREMNIVEKVVSVIKACHREGVPVFITKHHDPDPSPRSNLYKWWGNPIIKGAEDWKLIKDIEAISDRKTDTIIEEKSTYDAFHDLSLIHI